MPRYAAFDIGSNSIRMEAAEVNSSGPPQILASAREVTRLGESVFHTGRISREAIELSCNVLAAMASQYQRLDVAGVRAVATSSVRDARNQAEFLERASQAAGTPVEVISGREEARLIHLGVQTRWPQTGRRILVVDIGGGSAEIIASEDGHMRDAVSKPLGAVRLKEIFLAADPPSELELHRMQAFIEEKLSGVASRFGAAGWDRAVATSGTAHAVACAIGSIPRPKRERADRVRVPAAQIRQLYRRLCPLSLEARRRVTGIGPRRAEIIVPGLAVLARVLSGFGLSSAYYCAAGVRDGIIADLAARGVGRERAQLSLDQRQEVERISLHYGVSRAHSRKVASLARTLFHELQPLHQLPLEMGKILEASAYLHDVGHYVSDLSHHKHSHYLVVNSDMPGFTNPERALIANLCRYHRKSLPAPHHANHQVLDGKQAEALLPLIPMLRLADALDRSHTQPVGSVQCRIADGKVVLRLSSQGEIDLEMWAAEQAAQLFRQYFGLSLVLLKDAQ